MYQAPKKRKTKKKKRWSPHSGEWGRKGLIVNMAIDKTASLKNEIK